ncbi:hypothetical protein CY34DRAFT_12345 [Suillus luteus UH-Slu-Lm8-n1]|uniref:Unplaced genomic scaffold CY34scaffold_106, whole genome shotgun sequence n=1 Tax=Suillus luteus UH-Slu-Lm8-n1 TaxID=930992 RepID=A0A0D0BH74_9AGAM|nr:hypothetical protein CY34DRAFT_12345 [Suillus luteus UH-Slu-Lm8-n1]
MSRFPHPEDAASTCMDPGEDAPDEQVLPKEAEDDSALLHNHFHDSPIVPHGHEEFIFSNSAMDIDPLPSPELPVSLLHAAIEACSHKIHQSGSSSLTHVFEGLETTLLMAAL